MTPWKNLWYYSDAKSNYIYSIIVHGHMEIVIYTQDKYQTIKVLNVMVACCGCMKLLQSLN